MKQFTLIDHTADVGIDVCGKTKEELFINAARGMFSLMISLPQSGSRLLSKQVMFKGLDDHELLVDWLQELLYVALVRHLFPFRYEHIEFTEGMGIAHIQFIPLQMRSAILKREIKAVTHHLLDIQQDNGYFHTKIIFDI